MTKARDLANLISGGFTEADIPNLSASKITSGTFADARIAASNVSQHATSFDDNKIVNDISTLALRQSSNENKSAYNTNSMTVDVFQDETGIGTKTNVFRNTEEFLSSVSKTLDTSWNNFNFNQSPFTGNPWSKLTTDIISGTQPTEIGDLGSGGTLKVSGVPHNQYAVVGIDVAEIAWGSAYEWEVLLVHENANSSACYPWYSITDGKNHTDTTTFPVRNSATSNFFYKGANGNGIGDDNFNLATGTNGLHVYFNLGYSSGIRGNHTDGGAEIWNASSNSIPQGNRILTRIVYDGANGTLKAHVNANNSSTVVTKDIYFGGTGSGLLERFTTLPTSGHPYFVFGQHNSSANSNNNFQLWYKKQNTTINATGSVESTVTTAPSSVSSMGAIITYQDYAGTNALNTDIVLKLSADNGSNYSTATLTAMPDFSSGIKMAKVNDLSVTAGTQLKYKIEFANQSASKEARIRGVSLQY